MNARRLSVSVLIVALVAVSPVPALAEPVPATPTSRIVDYGVNGHPNYTDSTYRDTGQVLKAFKSSGARYMRIAAPWKRDQGQWNFDVYAKAGVKMLYVLRWRDEGLSQLAAIAQIEARHPGSTYGIEGTNEVAQNAQTYALARDTMIKVHDAIKADPVLKDIPVFNYTTDLIGGSRFDIATVHPYGRNGASPYGSIAKETAQQRALYPDKPIALTETGYSTAYNSDGVNEEVQAAYALAALGQAARLDVDVCFYELLDQKFDPQASNSQKAFGIYRADFKPKLAALALGNLRAIATSDGVDPGYSPPPLDIDLANMPKGARYVLFKGSQAGDWRLLVFRTEQAWKNKAPVDLAPIDVTLTLPAARDVDLYDPIAGRAKVRTATSTKTFKFALGLRPVLLAFGS